MLMSVSTELELRNAVNNATSGVFVAISLANDIQLTETTLTISANKHIKLTSTTNGGKFFKLIGASGADTLTVHKDGLLVLDGIIITHMCGVGCRGVNVQTGGTLTLLKGEISGNKGRYNGAPLFGGSFILGGGVYNSGTFTMSGGTIANNIANHGGGIYNSYRFRLSGGKISGNASSVGGGVYALSSDFSLSGGEISVNTATKGLLLNNFYGLNISM
jgi:hypothetical protein